MQLEGHANRPVVESSVRNIWVAVLPYEVLRPQSKH